MNLNTWIKFWNLNLNTTWIKTGLFSPCCIHTLIPQQSMVFRICAVKLMVSIISKTDPHYHKCYTKLVHVGALPNHQPWTDFLSSGSQSNFKYHYLVKRSQRYGISKLHLTLMTQEHEENKNNTIHSKSHKGRFRGNTKCVGWEARGKGDRERKPVYTSGCFLPKILKPFKETKVQSSWIKPQINGQDKNISQSPNKKSSVRPGLSGFCPILDAILS